MYQKIHRWSDEDETVAVADIEETTGEDTTQAADEETFAIDYKERIRPEDEY